MDLGLKGKTALVTGASRGIGFGVAMLLAEEGCNLHIASRNRDDLEAARRKIVEAHPVDVRVHAVDLARPDNVLQLARDVGPVDILVNNAGSIPHAPITAFDDRTWREGWDLKVFGYVNLTREYYRVMCASRRGVIVNVVGVAGERPIAHYIAGSMGNAALMAMCRALGAESVAHGVRVVGVNPGGIETDRQVASWQLRAQEKLGDPERWRDLAVNRPIKRLGTVDECAATIVFLCSPRSSYTSGTVVTVDAGTSAA
jgi:NAD(P)-dependent dehydrogenase (short-subunit alcohol dehydrogenase family)